MITQNFFGHVDQVAGETIVNVGNQPWPTPEQRAERRRELLKRAEWHIEQRDAYGKMSSSNGYARITLVSALLMIGLGAYCLQDGLRHAADLSWVFVVLVAVMAVSSHSLQNYRAHCRTEWNAHNAAVVEINRLLAGL
jgi:hypothetical protein